MKRICRLIAAIAAAAALLVGCSAPAASLPASSEAKEAAFTPSLDTSTSVTIEVRGSWKNFEALEAVATDWNQIYPNATINYVKVDDYNKHLVSLVQASDKPDLVMYDLDAYYTDSDTINANLVDLNTLGLNTDAYAPGALALATADDGRMLTLNWGMNAPGFLVNETLLEKLGLKVPTTHEEFLDVCAKLKEAGYTPIAGCYINIYSLLMANDSSLRLASEEDQDALYQMFDTADERCADYFVPEFETLFDLMDKGYLDHETNLAIEDIYESSILRFFEGDIPFFCATTEVVSGMAKRESKSEAFTANPFEYAFVSLPVENETPALSRSAVSGFALVNGSAHQEWAAEFLRFLCSTEELNKMAEVKGVPSLTGTGSSDPRFASLSEIPAENKVNEGQYPVLQRIHDPYCNTLWAIANGDVTTVEEAKADFLRRMKEGF